MKPDYLPFDLHHFRHRWPKAFTVSLARLFLGAETLVFTGRIFVQYFGEVEDFVRLFSVDTGGRGSASLDVRRDILEVNYR